MNLGKNGESARETFRSWLQKMGSTQWVILLLLGLLLAVIALPVPDNEGDENKKTGQSFLNEDITQEGGAVSKTELEQKLEALLSSVEGVGEVQVILMTGEDENAGSYYGSGQQKITGVLVAAQGADDSVVCQNIVQAVMALFQVEAHKIKVMKMK